MSKQTFVIIGASLAGAKAAAELREKGFDGDVILVSGESEPPYERPPLSKDLLQGKGSPEDAYVFAPDFYAEKSIELISGVKATEIDPAQRLVRLEDGRELHYDKLGLCTGAISSALDVEGADLENILFLRSLSESQELAERLSSGGRLVVVGSGWIGSEVAASARSRDVEVTVVDSASLPNERIFGTEIGEFYAQVHREHGVTLHLGDGVEAFLGEEGRVTAVRTTSGEEIPADYVVLGVGATPVTELAEQAGLAVDDGIVVDAALRTSEPDIYAAGDVASALNPFYGEHIRVEHWANAQNQGEAMARSMLGQEVSYDRIPYFFSDQYDVGMEYSGYAPSWDEVVFRGSREEGEFVAFWLADGRVVAGMNVNVWDVNEHVQTLIRSRAKVDVADLTDTGVDLKELADSAG